MRLRLLLIAAVAAAYWSDAYAAKVRDHSLGEKVKASDLVIVGRARNEAMAVDGYVSIHPLLVLKGRVSGDIKMAARGVVAELNTDCCKSGAIYLLFLRNIGKGVYLPFNGRYSIYEITTQE